MTNEGVRAGSAIDSPSTMRSLQWPACLHDQLALTDVTCACYWQPRPLAGMARVRPALISSRLDKLRCKSYWSNCKPCKKASIVTSDGIDWLIG